jgi:hypothetical protein
MNALPPHVLAFVQSAVRLPSERLKRIDRDWDQLFPHRMAVSEFVRSSEEVRREVSVLDAYVLAEARRAAAESPEDAIPEDIVDAIFPAARALLLRSALENSNDERMARAFAVLTEPFVDILPKSQD